ncbi:MAG: shikimate kinase [Flavobacteriaceae bacterium]|nr:shikimate kinase [Flavobacteriaceae bacterium]
MNNSKFQIDSNIIIIGYMGSGKSLVSKSLANILNVKYLDLDEIIENREKMKISEIFEQKGELQFRRIEKEVLLDVLESSKNNVISLGGGTPCYFDNMSLVNTKSKYVFYIINSNKVLSKRLFKERKNRPVISKIESLDKMMEFVSKHIFERMHFYNMAKYHINAEKKDLDLIINEIIEILNQ